MTASTTSTKRKLGLWAATALVVGNMIGSGVFLLPASLAAYGGISIVAWVITAAGAMLLARVFARLGRAYPDTGGPYAYSRRAFGDFVGFQTAWGYWIAIWAGNAAIAVAFVGSNFGAVSAAAALTLWAFIGLESATVPAGDVKDPERTIPRATMLGTIVAAAVYVLGTVAVMGVIPADTLAASTAPFADAAREMFGSWAGKAVAAGAVISAFGALNGWILLQGQVPMAAARDRLFPRRFARTDANGTPVFGLVASSVLVTGLMFMNYTKSLVDQFAFIILLATLTTLIPYAYAAAAELLVLATDRARFSGGRLARGAGIAALAFAYSVWTIAGSGYEVVFKGFMLLLAGIPVYVWMRWRAAVGPDTASLGLPHGVVVELDGHIPRRLAGSRSA